MDYVARQLLTSQVDGLAWMWYFGLAGLGIGGILVLLGVALVVNRPSRARGILVALGGAGSAIISISLLFSASGRELSTLGRLMVVGALLLIMVSVLIVGLAGLLAYQASRRQ